MRLDLLAAALRMHLCSAAARSVFAVRTWMN
jgi:hypothetical protein